MQRVLSVLAFAAAIVLTPFFVAGFLVGAAVAATRAGYKEGLGS